MLKQHNANRKNGSPLALFQNRKAFFVQLLTSLKVGRFDGLNLYFDLVL